jgi:predicted nucleic acid-binding protein
VILLDTTVLTYAVGAGHELAGPCERFMELAMRGELRATTTVAVIQEFTHVRARRRPRADAAALARGYMSGLAPLVRSDVEDLREGLDIFESKPDIGAFDAVLAATARRRGWAIASADDGFSGLAGLPHLDPAQSLFLTEALAHG